MLLKACRPSWQRERERWRQRERDGERERERERERDIIEESRERSYRKGRHERPELD